jgi:hypothetical protein
MPLHKQDGLFSLAFLASIAVIWCATIFFIFSSGSSSMLCNDNCTMAHRNVGIICSAFGILLSIHQLVSGPKEYKKYSWLFLVICSAPGFALYSILFYGLYTGGISMH